MPLKYYKELDGIRGLAALMIMFFHFMKGSYFLNPTKYHTILTLSKFGQTGVTLFFVLSGFLITRILLDTKSNENYFLSFYLRRSLRIFPLYYLFLVIVYFIVPLIRSTPIERLTDTWSYWVYLQNFAVTFHWKSVGYIHLWSLAVEEHFYLFWPIIVYYCPLRNLLKVIMSIMIISLLCRIYLIHLGYGTFYFTFTTFDCLAIGALLAINEIRNWFTYKVLFICAGVLFISLIVVWSILGNEGNTIVQYVKLPITAAFI